MEKTPAWVGITYIIYCLMVWSVCIVGTGYAVVERGFSGWWIVGGICLASCGWSPWKWHALCSGIEPSERQCKANGK